MGSRIVITGMGWVTPLGNDVPSAWDALIAGRSAMAPIERFDAATFPTNFAAEVKNFDLCDTMGKAADRHADALIGTKYALSAAAQAWKQSGLGSCDGSERLPGLKPNRVGVYMGAGEGTPDHAALMAAGIAGWQTDERTLDDPTWTAEIMQRLNPQGEIEQEPHMVVTHIASAFGCQGPSLNCMTACAAGTQSVGEASEILRRGDADVMLAGGSHSMIHPLGLSGFIRLTAMSRRTDDPATASRPFDRTRDGFVMGEGAGVLVLETESHARSRGAHILAEVAGFGSTADAFRITDIQPDGLGGQTCMGAALKQAGINPVEPDALGRPPVQYISAHGTGTKENDSIETKAVKGLFGPQAQRIPFSSVKSMLGHMIQAAGAVELMTCVKAIETGIAPPTINLNEQDPNCDLDYVPNKARDMTNFWKTPEGHAGGIDVALSNGFGFGGQNDTICVRRYQA